MRDRLLLKNALKEGLYQPVLNREHVTVTAQAVERRNLQQSEGSMQSSSREQDLDSVFTVSFDPPPSPPRTRISLQPMSIGRRLICILEVPLADQDDAAILSGSDRWPIVAM